MTKFIIFASARSGSTSLAKVLGESKDVKMTIEPFNPDYLKWNKGARNYSQFIKNPKSMGDALREIFSKYSAMKVLDYQFDKKIYFSMLANREYKILFLRRRNLLESSISSAVAHQVGEWHKQDNLSIYENLKPLDVKEVEDWINHVGGMNKTYSNYLEEIRKGEYMPLIYEDLYSESFNENKSKLIKITDFLGIAMPPDGAIKKHMTPLEAKINYKDLYKKIPNYEEIMKKLMLEEYEEKI